METCVSWILLIGFLIWKKYFNFWKICDEEKVWLASNKLDDEAEKWWEDIQIDRKGRGKHPICSWQRIKKELIDLWFPNDYYDIVRLYKCWL